MRPCSGRATERGSKFLISLKWTSHCMTHKKGKKQESSDERSLKETERIREATLKRLLSTPPKRHDEMIAERKSSRRQSNKRPK